MQLNVLNDLAKAKRRWTEKNAADESKYKYMRMRTWSTQQRIALMRMASMTAEAAAYVSDSALDSDTIFLAFVW